MGATAVLAALERLAPKQLQDNKAPIIYSIVVEARRMGVGDYPEELELQEEPAAQGVVEEHSNSTNSTRQHFRWELSHFRAVPVRAVREVLEGRVGLEDREDLAGVRLHIFMVEARVLMVQLAQMVQMAGAEATGWRAYPKPQS